jgi:tetratricopeptide (TPR) repeat protein
VFCRSCWANIADGSPECPRCHADPGAAPAAATPARAGGAPGEPPPKKKRKGDRQNRLIALVGLLVLVLIVGPTTVEWAVRRWRGDPAGPGPGSSERPPLEATASTADPTRPSADAGPDAASLREAYELYQQGRVAEACDRYRDLANRLGTPEVRRNLGSCLARLGREAQQANLFDQAADHYRRALDASADDASIWTSLALAHLKARDFGRAQGVLEQAAARFPDDPDILSLLAEARERQGRSREAAETLRRLLARHPGHARGTELLAAIEKEQKVEGSYWSQESRHFVVRYEGAGGIDLGRSVVDYLEEAYETVGRALGYFPEHRVQVSIYSQEVLGEVSRVPAHFVRGVFEGDTRKIRLNFAKSVAYTNDLSQLVRHEYTHAVIHEVSNGKAPVWVHEGLAQVMEGRAPWPLPASVPRQYLTLGGIDQLARAGNVVGVISGYVLAHVAMQHLVDQGGTPKVAEFLRRIGQGDTIDQALRQAFGFGSEDVEARIAAVAGRS